MRFNLGLLSLVTCLCLFAQAESPLIEISPLSANGTVLDVSSFDEVTVRRSANSQRVELRQSGAPVASACVRSLGNLSQDLEVTYKENEGAWFNSNVIVRRDGTRRSEVRVLAVYNFPGVCEDDVDVSSLTPSRIVIFAQW